jgi:predicted nucleic acid-binding protein
MWGALTAIRLDGRLARSAGALADRHGLRALDAIHLASALSIATPADQTTFVTFDRRLAEAAIAEGLTVLPEVA